MQSIPYLCAECLPPHLRRTLHACDICLPLFIKYTPGQGTGVMSPACNYVNKHLKEEYALYIQFTVQHMAAAVLQI